MSYPPAIQIPVGGIPADEEERRNLLADAFGTYLLWALNDSIQKSKSLIRSAEARGKLGGAIAKPYAEAASQLTIEGQDTALHVAEATLRTFAQNILLILSAQGITLHAGDDHAIQFRLTAEIRDIESMRIMIEEVINRGGKTAFQSRWGRWLKQNQK